MADMAKATLVMMGMEDGLSLRQACEKHDVAPSTVLRWVDTDSELAEQYTRARTRLSEYRANEIVEIADDSSLTPEDRKVRIYARQWESSKLQPKKYGEKLQAEITHHHTLADVMQAAKASRGS